MAVTVSDGECQLLVLRGEEIASSAVEFMNLVCLELGIPIHICSNQLINAACLTWIESQLVSSSEGHQRKRLLVAGAYLEEQITVCALHALSLGYEVFLLKDFVATRTVGHVQAFDMRLFQAGVVPTTLRQLLYEWLSQEEISERQAAKRKLIELIDVVGLRPA